MLNAHSLVLVIFLKSFKLRHAGHAFILVLASLLISAPAFSSQPIVIVNKSVEADRVNLKELRAIFTMKKRFWAEGKPISVFVLPKDHQTHKQFCKQRLSIFPRQLETVWYRLVYTGTGKAPVKVADETELQERVANTPGAIGYVEIMNDDTKTKILTVD